MISNDILDIAKQASLKISTDKKTIDIKHRFRFSDKSTWGLLFFLVGGVFISAMSLSGASDITSKVLGIVLGLLLMVFSILTLTRQCLDRLTLSDTVIKVRHNLKRATIPINKNMTVKMKTELIKIRRAGTLGSDFIMVSHFLQDSNNETPVLKFQMDKSNTDKAVKLGNEITRAINERFRQLS
jgi:hypothetical protein